MDDPVKLAQRFTQESTVPTVNPELNSENYKLTKSS